MNIFSPGTARLMIKDESLHNGNPVYMLEAKVEQNDFFKRIYEAEMKITSVVEKDSKVSLEYRELSITPEKERTKRIAFDPKNNIAEREGIKFKIPDNTYDPLSVF
ncbi:MAG: DUF3108 domain-containing protein [Candidatus Omnitrophica bacterium]|nr:DUF3108 domain-containing protein [Candidatus Omnitrophota bacterium]